MKSMTLSVATENLSFKLPSRGSSIARIDANLQKQLTDPFGIEGIFQNRYTPEERLFDLRSKFKMAVSRVSMHLPTGWRDRIFSQIDSLLDPEEWDFFDTLPTEDCFNTFLRLLLILKPTRLPGIGIANDGILVAAWTVGVNRLTIQCLENDSIKLALARFDDNHIERAAIDTYIDRVAEILRPYRPDIWFEDAK